MAAKMGQTSNDVDEPAKEVEAVKIAVVPTPASEEVYLDLEAKEIVRNIGDTTFRYRPGDAEFGVYVESKAYKTVNGRKSGA
jgi:hypothetical protein